MIPHLGTAPLKMDRKAFVWVDFNEYSRAKGGQVDAGQNSFVSLWKI